MSSTPIPIVGKRAAQRSGTGNAQIDHRQDMRLKTSQSMPAPSMCPLLATLCFGATCIQCASQTAYKRDFEHQIEQESSCSKYEVPQLSLHINPQSHTPCKCELLKTAVVFDTSEIHKTLPVLPAVVWVCKIEGGWQCVNAEIPS